LMIKNQNEGWPWEINDPTRKERKRRCSRSKGNKLQNFKQGEEIQRGLQSDPKPRGGQSSLHHKEFPKKIIQKGGGCVGGGWWGVNGEPGRLTRVLMSKNKNERRIFR